MRHLKVYLCLTLILHRKNGQPCQRRCNMKKWVLCAINMNAILNCVSEKSFSRSLRSVFLCMQTWSKKLCRTDLTERVSKTGLTHFTVWCTIYNYSDKCQGQEWKQDINWLYCKYLCERQLDYIFIYNHCKHTELYHAQKCNRGPGRREEIINPRDVII